MIKNIRYGKLGTISFEYNGRTVVIREPMDVLLVGADLNAAERWIMLHYGTLLIQLY